MGLVTQDNSLVETGSAYTGTITLTENYSYKSAALTRLLQRLGKTCLPV